MSEHNALLCDLVEWVVKCPRPYAEVIDAWRTSCPRLQVWEDALDAGYVERSRASDGTPTISVTEAGRRFLNAHARSR